MPNETIGECSARYDALLHKIDSVQSEIALLSSRSSVNPEDYRTRICELERMISHLSEEADQVYALLAHSISVSVDRRYREMMAELLLRRRRRADIADSFGYNYFYLRHVLAAYSRQSVSPISEDAGDGKGIA